MRRLIAVLLFAVLATFAGILKAHYGTIDTPFGPAATGSPPAGWRTSDNTIARDQKQLSRLAVRIPEPMSGYDREQFGPAWSDDVDVEGGHDGCDKRFICTRGSESELTCLVRA